MKSGTPMIGWILFGVSVAWHAGSRLYAERKRARLMAFMMMVLLHDELAADHRLKFRQWVQQSDVSEATVLFGRGSKAIQSLADRLGNDPNGSLAAVAGFLQECQRESARMLS
jgi:hypothetical protein